MGCKKVKKKEDTKVNKQGRREKTWEEVGEEMNISSSETIEELIKWERNKKESDCVQ